MKYVMLETSEGKKLPFLFPEELVHADFAHLMIRLVKIQTKQSCRVISAGFVEPGLDVTVHGESESIGIKSQHSDAAYIALGAAISMMPSYMVGDLLLKAKKGKSGNTEG